MSHVSIVFVFVVSAISLCSVEGILMIPVKKRAKRASMLMKFGYWYCLLSSSPSMPRFFLKECYQYSSGFNFNILVLVSKHDSPPW